MKEATGELNMTVVTVVAIAAIGAFFYAFVWPAIKDNINRTTKCANAVCGECTNSTTCVCTYFTTDNSVDTITCPAKNDGTT